MSTQNQSRSPLRSDAKLVLMTRQAQRLVHGRSAQVEEHRTLPGIIGLLRFASSLRILWDAAMNDDPYADLWLVRVDQALKKSQQELSALSEQLQKLFSAMPDAVSVELASSDAPMEVALRFANPYAFVGAYLL